MKLERIFLLTTWNRMESRTAPSYVNVLKAQLYDHVNGIYPIGRFGFIISSYLEHDQLMDHLKMKRGVPYIFVDVTESIVNGGIKGFFPECNIEIMREITKISLSLSLDAILDKISRSGTESLTKEEHVFLEAHKKDITDEKDKKHNN